MDAGGATLAQAPIVVIAAGHQSAAFEPCRRLPLQPVRGQLSLGAQGADMERPDPFPPWPVNGRGSFVPNLPLACGRAWIAGASYGRGDAQAQVRAGDQGANWQRLRALLPQVAARLEPAFGNGNVTAWAGVRCASLDRLPIVGELGGAAREEPPSGLWIASALGSRGLTFALLCAELLAAQLHGEPPPLAPRLARAIDSRRF